MDANACIAHIKGSREERSRAISMIFHDVDLRNSVKSYVLQHGGSKDDVEIVFDDMITQFVKMAYNRSDLDIRGDLNGYLFGISRMLWKQELRKRKVHQKYIEHSQAEFTEDVIHLEQLVLNNERSDMLNKLLDHVGAKCKSVLMRWAHGYSMIEIAEAEGYKSDMMARKKKSKCLKSLKSYLTNHPDMITLFRE